MRIFFVVASLAMFLSACDDHRVFEKNHDFTERHWIATDQPEFEFEIADSTARYNLYCNLRNSASYPWSRVFVRYTLRDSTRKILEGALTEHFLFDAKTGKPFGSSGIGDLYDHQFPILENHTFPHTGKFTVSFGQYMRMDTLKGILAVGLRVERATPEDE